ncbi:hypothetical protein GCM10008024_28440 [Allgaiera indica]|uniref:Uncharacterized protein n=1 Tax=Allgaiera indica TaxID=765699 RepID=A0AAN4USX0_9RHOB|nr:hypothetical protein GCM10008024_28440 [Allgaiera indica]
MKIDYHLGGIAAAGPPRGYTPGERACETELNHGLGGCRSGQKGSAARYPAAGRGAQRHSCPLGVNATDLLGPHPSLPMDARLVDGLWIAKAAKPHRSADATSLHLKDKIHD